MTKVSSRPPAVRPDGLLYVEVRLTHRDHGGPKAMQIKEEVEKYLRRHYTEIQIGTVALDTPLSSIIAEAQVTGQSRSRSFPDDQFYLVAANEMEILVYALASERDPALHDWDSEDEDDVESRYFTSTPLPHERLDRLWSSLVYEEPVGEIMLRALVRSIKEQHAPAQPSPTSCKNTILLHGPPGSGKTSLAQALAQRLSIRLSELYPRTELLEVASDALLSKFFGESSKSVGKLFKTMVEMAMTDKSRLLVVLFDEVESIAGCREQALKSSEVADAHRAAVQMLRGLDAIRNCANVMFICTTNFIGNIDSAFLDRIFLREYVDTPGVNSIFEILRGELNGLLQTGRMTFTRMVYDETDGHVIAESVTTTNSPKSPDCSQENRGATDRLLTMPPYIPDATWAATHWVAYKHTVTSRLRAMAQRAKGISGRRLRDLVEQARLKYTIDTPCDLTELLDAINRVVEQETSDPERPLAETADTGVEEDFIEYDSGSIAALLARMDGDQAVSTVAGPG